MRASRAELQADHSRPHTADVNDVFRAPEEPLEQALDACRRLADASAVSLLAIDNATGAMRLMAGGEAQGPRQPIAAMKQKLLSLTVGTLHWTPSPEDQAAATLTVKIGVDHHSAQFLALAFTDALPMTRSRVARIVPDLVALISAHLEQRQRQAELERQHAAAVAALDDGECGVIAIKPDHSVLFANAAASTILANGDDLRIKRGLLRPTDHKQAVRFEAALDAVLDGHEDVAMGTPALVLLLPRKLDKRPLIVVIVPARSAPAGADMEGAAALVYFLAPKGGLARGLDTIAKLHGLSQVEGRLLTQLCTGQTLAETAESMRIKLETARAYLKQVFVKTGTHRQAELVTLMLHYQRATRGAFDFRPA